MSYFYVIVATVMTSLVGTLVKVASVMAPANVITFSRFFFGVLVILLICLLTRHKPHLHYGSIWIFIAAAGKCINYFIENYALHKTVSFGNIIGSPVQAVTLCFCSVIFFHEKLGPRKILSTALCVLGILIVSWNRNSRNAFTGEALPLMLLFVLSGIGASVFILAQKMMIQKLPATDMNLSVFLLGAMVAAVPMGVEIKNITAFSVPSLLALIGLGVITGGAFLLMAKGLKELSVVVAGLIQNAMPIFSLSWGAIFLKEPIKKNVILGTSIFLVGLMMISITPKKGIFVN